MVMLFGMKNTPPHFQQAIKLRLGDLVDVCLLVYLNDILIYLATAKDHDRHVRAVF